MALLAELRTEPQPLERRSRARRTLCLEAETTIGATANRVVIRNLSETGLLLETDEALSTNEALTVELPQAGAVEARVVWTRAPFFGCEFVKPVGRAAVSAALLMSPIPEPPVVLSTPADTTWQLPEPTPISALPPATWEAGTALILFAGSALAFAMALLTLRVG